MNALPPAPPPAPPARTDRGPAVWLAAAVALGVGAFLGYQAAYTSSLGGLNGIGAGFLVILIGVLVGVALLIGIANVLRPGGRGRVASRYAFAGGGLLALGGVGGALAVPLLDIGYHEPVGLQARGEASITLAGVPTFEPSAGGRADCQSVADSTNVAVVTALSLGTFSGNVLRATISLPASGGQGGHVSLFVDAAHLPAGAPQPMWDTDAVTVDASPGGGKGSLTFEAAALGPGDPLTGEPPPSWPPSLSGTITWACGAWFDPAAPAESPVAGQVTLDLTAADWEPLAGATGSCGFEPDGSVAGVTADQVGALKRQPMSLQLSLDGDPRAGGEVHLMLAVHIDVVSRGGPLLGALVAATSGSAVSWEDLVTIDEISDGGLSGRLTVSDLPMAGTQTSAWPATLSGQLSWDCD